MIMSDAARPESKDFVWREHAQLGRRRFHQILAKLFHEHGSGPIHQLTRAHTQRRTALFAAASNRHGIKIMAALLAAKANPNLYDPAV